MIRRAGLLIFVCVAVLAIAAPAVARPAPTAATAAVLDAPAPCDVTLGPCTAPAVGVTWQWVLQGMTVSVPAAYPEARSFDVDGWDNGPAVVDAIMAQGALPVAYFSAGTWENWRPDANRYPAEVKGRRNGWPGEKWVDIRRWDVLEPILRDRFAVARSKGFVAVEPDNVDGYSNRTGFQLTYADQLLFNSRVANLAHSLGLTVALKNDVEQINDLQPYFDFALNEECARYNECGPYTAFTSAGKAAWNVEYESNLSFCAVTAPIFGAASLRKSYDLFSEPWEHC